MKKILAIAVLASVASGCTMLNNPLCLVSCQTNTGDTKKELTDNRTIKRIMPDSTEAPATPQEKKK